MSAQLHTLSDFKFSRHNKMFMRDAIVPLVLFCTIHVATSLKDEAAGIANSLYNVKLACVCIGQPGTYEERCCPWGDRYNEQTSAKKNMFSYVTSGFSFFKKAEEPKHAIDLKSYTSSVSKYANQLSSTIATHWKKMQDYFHNFHLKAVEILMIPCTCAMTLPSIATVINVINTWTMSAPSAVWDLGRNFGFEQILNKISSVFQYFATIFFSPPHKESTFESLRRQRFSFDCFENIQDIYGNTLWIICLLTSHVVCIMITRFYYMSLREDARTANFTGRERDLQMRQRQDSGIAAVSQPSNDQRSATSLTVHAPADKASTITKSGASAERSKRSVLSKRDSSKLSVRIKPEPTQDNISAQSQSSMFIESNKSEEYTISQSASDEPDLYDLIGANEERPSINALPVIVDELTESTIGSLPSGHDELSKIKDLTTIRERPEFSRQQSRLSSKMKPAPLFFNDGPSSRTSMLSGVTSALSTNAVVTTSKTSVIASSINPNNPSMTRDTALLQSPIIAIQSDVTSEETGESIKSGDLSGSRRSEEEQSTEDEDGTGNGTGVDDDDDGDDDDGDDGDDDDVDTDGQSNEDGESVVENDSSNNSNRSVVVEDEHESHSDVEEQQQIDRGNGDSGTVSRSGSSETLSQEEHDEHMNHMANTIEMLSRENSELRSKLGEVVETSEVLSGSLGWGTSSTSSQSSSVSGS